MLIDPMPCSLCWIYQAFSMMREPSSTSRLPKRSAVARTARRLAMLKGCIPSAKAWSPTNATFSPRRTSWSFEMSTLPVNTSSARSRTSTIVTSRGSRTSTRVRPLLDTIEPGGSMVEVTSLMHPNMLWVGQMYVCPKTSRTARSRCSKFRAPA